jgi:site-specific DNA-methyltransferase (adenine-specific)
MAVERIHRATKRTPEEQARLQEIRNRFQSERPNLSQLVAQDGYNEPVPHGLYLGLQQAIAELKKAREAAGLSLAQVAEKSGIDKAALSRLETGRQINPTVATLARYARAVGKRFRWTFEDAPPAPDHVAHPNPGGSGAAGQAAQPGVPRQTARRDPVVEIVRGAYVAVRGPELHSTDWVIADPDLDAAFLKRCRELGAPGSDFDLNWRLFNARKAKHLAGIPKAKKFVIPEIETDQFLWASEIAFRMILDRYQEAGQGGSLDRIICDPEVAKQFDQVAHRLAPGFSPLYYRWGALSLRKAAGRLRREAEKLDSPKFESLGRVRDVKSSALPRSQGLYLMGVAGRPLFVGDTLNIRGRVEHHIECGGGEALPEWVLSNYSPKDITLDVLPMPGSEYHAVEVLDLKAKTELRPALNLVS